jgi:hypothetical protein
MIRPKIVLSSLDAPLSVSVIKGPFAVLLNADDPEWVDGSFLRRKTIELLNAGCRYCVCFGRNSEAVHDQIDDVIVNRNSEMNVLTTFHDDETAEDVVNFFTVVAMNGMAQGLLLVRDGNPWLTLLQRGATG